MEKFEKFFLTNENFEKRDLEVDESIQIKKDSQQIKLDMRAIQIRNKKKIWSFFMGLNLFCLIMTYFSQLMQPSFGLLNRFVINIILCIFL